MSRTTIYLTGDTHGRFERIEEFCRAFKTTKSDTLIILGDAGINYHEDSYDNLVKKYLSELPITIFSIQGNHEQRPSNIPTYKEIEWHGAKVYREDAYRNLLFAKDGEIYTLNNKKVLVIGGAYSIDKEIRLARGYKWFKDEQPSDQIKQQTEENLNKANWEVDTVLTHTAPLKYEPTEVFLKGVDQSKVDKTTEKWLDTIEDKLSYKHWYLGHYHTEKKIDKIRIMFKNYTILE